MAIRKYKPTTPGRRASSVVVARASPILLRLPARILKSLCSVLFPRPVVVTSTDVLLLVTRAADISVSTASSTSSVSTKTA